MGTECPACGGALQAEDAGLRHPHTDCLFYGNWMLPECWQWMHKALRTLPDAQRTVLEPGVKYSVWNEYDRIVSRFTIPAAHEPAPPPIPDPWEGAPEDSIVMLREGEA